MPPPHPPTPAASSPSEVVATYAARVAHVAVGAGDRVSADQVLLFLEVMKMEQPVLAPADGIVDAVAVSVGDEVAPGTVLVRLGPARAASDQAPPDLSQAGPDEGATGGPGAGATGAPGEGARGAPEAGVAGGPAVARQDLAEVLRRRALLEDGARPDAVARRRERGGRTARENVADLLDADSFSELGGLAIAAQRGRRDLDELIARTPADGLVTGTGTVNADRVGPARARVAVAAYDATVLAGTQGHVNHRKSDRLFELALAHRLPTVIFAEGGGGRPGDVDAPGASWLDAAAFALFGRLAETVPTIAIVHGRCFAGNAALAGTADVLIATEGSSLGMAGPAMIAGGGLGEVHPDDVGPMEVQVANGVVDVLVADEAAAVAVTARLLSVVQGPALAGPGPVEAADQTTLRDAIPANRKRTYDVRAIVDTVFDVASVVELRQGSASGMRTGVARLDGVGVGWVANDPVHLGGAIDADGADSLAAHLALCDRWDLPVVVLCDTPGFMVGPDAERDGGVRRFSALFRIGPTLSVPLLAVVTRKGYGLGAQAMLGGHLQVPVLTVAWPTAELGPMGLEGAVDLGFKRELDSVADPDERARRRQGLIDLAYAHAGALNVASHGEIDDVIDPADTRRRLAQALLATGRTATS